jgi:hypothetical protein
MLASGFLLIVFGFFCLIFMTIEKVGRNARRRLMLAEHERRKAMLYLEHGRQVRALYESHRKRAPEKFHAPPYDVEES